jgi:hypothetical protein
MTEEDGYHMDGPEYILVACNLAGSGKSSPPLYAYTFREMVGLAFNDSNARLLARYGEGDAALAEMIAARPLKDYEAEPVRMILEALEMVKLNGDTESETEVVHVGLALLAKWPHFLTARGGHPDLVPRRSTNE